MTRRTADARTGMLKARFLLLETRRTLGAAPPGGAVPPAVGSLPAILSAPARCQWPELADWRGARSGRPKRVPDHRAPAPAGSGAARLAAAVVDGGADGIVCQEPASPFIFEPMAIRVDPASLPDIPALVQLMQEFYLEAAYVLDRRRAANSFSVLVSNPSLGAVWLLRRDGHAAGYAVLTVRFSMEYGGVDAFIDDLFVRREHRRLGVGTAAMAGLVAECRRRGVLALHVEVGTNNTAANLLYRKFGLGLRADQRQTLTVELGG